MSDFLLRLAARSAGTLPGVRPLVAPRFMPVSDAPASLAAPGTAARTKGTPVRNELPSRPGETPVERNESRLIPDQPAREAATKSGPARVSATGVPLTEPARPGRRAARPQVDDTLRPALTEPAAAADRGPGMVMPDRVAGRRGPGRRDTRDTRDASDERDGWAELPGLVRPPARAGSIGLRPRIAEVAVRRETERPVVNVTIGRIEVRAAAPVVPVRTEPARPDEPKLTLEKYLEQRDKGER